ncbi:zinc-dependent peptidase [Panacagrimonas sp.]|uniref:M90 family metallopeptidase n=1 Tax=Panacagrimonas sp. TaxID=2480088 RepID=UPI003B5216E0
MPADALIGLAALVAAIFFFAGRRQRARQYPLPDRSPLDAGDLLEDRLGWLARLSPAQRERFGEQVQRFLREKRFVGCGGLEVTDEMRLLVAGMASLLVLRPGAEPFPQLREVLLYPGPFLVPVTEPDEFGLVPDEPDERIGESWQGDRVILSWPDVEAGLDGDEVNVVVHEFAHQLDDDNGAGDGAPRLADYGEWSEVMQTEFERLRRHRRPRVLDPYGAESPAEFFGVVSEAFFQRGPELARHHARLYALLRDYYGFETA